MNWQGKANSSCGMNRVDFLVLASQSGTPVADLNDEEVSKELGDAGS